MLLCHSLISLLIKQIPFRRNIMIPLISQKHNRQKQRIPKKLCPFLMPETKPVIFQILRKIPLDHRIHNTLIQLFNHLHCLLLTESLQIIHGKTAQPPEIHSRSWWNNVRSRRITVHQSFHLLIKTPAVLTPDLIQSVKKDHSLSTLQQLHQIRHLQLHIMPF